MKEAARTQDLIAALTQDAHRNSVRSKTSARALRLATFGKYWLVGAVIILALSFWLLPRREDFIDRLSRPESYLLFVLWTLATMLPALKVYALAFPEGELSAPFQRISRFAVAPIAILLAWSLAHLEFVDFQFQLFRESSYLNGGCGMVILVAGALHATFLFSWIRRGATTSPVRAGAWAAVSTASFASFIVQFACANENPIHVLLWHFIPLMMLTAIAATAAKRVFRW
jgi:hypothetical protein